MNQALHDEPQVFALAPSVRTWPLDVSKTGEQFLVEVGDERRFAVSEAIYRVIELLDQGGRTLESLVDELRRKGIESADREVISRLIETVLIPRGIVEPPAGAETEAAPALTKRSSYLRVQVPLLSAELLRPVTGALAYLFHPAAFATLMSAIIFSQVHFYWKVFPTFEWGLLQLPMEQYALILLALNVTAMFHEFGHAAACRFFGCGHGKIGWGIYLFFPVFYTDVTAAWRLPRLKRAVVDLGGMYFEMLAAAVCWLAYLYTKSDFFVYMIVLLNLSLLGSLNPILRRDGYWLVADLIGQANLRAASLEALAMAVSRLAGRKPARRTHLADVPGWMIWAIYGYSVVTVLFTIRLVSWLGHRILGEILPQLPVLAQTLVAGTTPGSLDLLAVLEAILRLAFSVFFTYFVVSLMWQMTTSFFKLVRRSWAEGKSPEVALEPEARRALP